MTSIHPPSVRQPVSCEPCRRRKIKCSRTRPPCDTCRRRGLAETCIYLDSRKEYAPNSSPASNTELLKRVNNLESLLRQHTSASNDHNSPTASIALTLREDNQQFHPSPESLSSENLLSADLSSDFHSSHSTGLLTTSPSGNTKYEPRPSQWNSVLANTELVASQPIFDDQDDSTTFGFPFTADVIPSHNDLLALLPPVQQCDYLKSKYFAVFSPLFHILHDPTFHSQYAQFIEQPSSMSPSWLAILFTLLSLAIIALEEDDPVIRDLARSQDPSSIRALSKRYREAAMKCLAKQGVFWGKHNIQSLQALIMLVYAMGHSQEPTWIALGMTYNMAIALACHIDPSRLNLGTIESEERRRCWAGLMMLYTIQNITLGTTDPKGHITYDVRLPADVNDEDITISGVQENLFGPTQMSYLLFKFKLYDLTTKICQEAFSPSAPSNSVIQELDRQICQAQESWDDRYQSDTTFEALPIHHAVHLHILHSYSYQLFLLLHRPFFAQSTLHLGHPNESQIRCIASAEALLDIHRILSETPEFRPYKWYTNGLGSFHAFHAAAVLAVALLMPIYKPQYLKFKCMSEAALLRFESSAGRSKICERSARALRFLLATSSPNQSSQMTPTQDSDSGNSSNDLPDSNLMRGLTERLEPQHWLSPASMHWTEWDALMTTAGGP